METNRAHEIFDQLVVKAQKENPSHIGSGIVSLPNEMAKELGIDPASFAEAARAYAENNDSLRRFLSEQYGHVQREFAKAIQTCLPQLGKEQLYWRLDFLSGALTYAMADFGMIKRPADVSEDVHRIKAGRELIRFALAGFLATEPQG